MHRVPLCIAFLTLLSHAAASRDRIEHLQKSVLAPCCYTESVAQHTSDIAFKLRVEIANSVSQGKTDREILDAFAARYGARVLVDPRTLPKTWALLVPWTVAGLGALAAALILRRWRAATQAPAANLPHFPALDD